MYINFFKNLKLKNKCQRGLGCGSEEYLFAMYKALGTIHRGKLNTAQGGCGSQGVLYNPLQGMTIPGQRREDLELLPQILTRTLRDHRGSREAAVGSTQP